MSFIRELRRRNVIRVAMAYAVASWLIIQVVETILPAFGFGDAAVRYVVLGLAIALIPFLVFSWAFEITPEGLKRESDIAHERSTVRYSGRKIDRLIMLLLAVALSYFAFDKFVLGPARNQERVGQTAAQVESDTTPVQTDTRSIVVLPFLNLSDDPGNEYFSDGVTEEILSLLSRIHGLRVTARTSSFYFKDKRASVTEIAETLNVAHVLEGSVRKAGSQVRITAQLIDVGTNSHVWTQSWDRRLEDIFQIQDEIAAAVAAQIKVTLLGELPTASEIDPDAFALYLRGRFLMNLDTAESREQSVSLFQRALAIEPGYADAWSDLGVIYRRLGLLQPGREAIEHALAIDPGHAASWSRAGWLAERVDNDLPEAARLMQRAVDLNADDPTVMQNSAYLLWVLGRTDQSILMLERLSVLDPLHPDIQTTLGFAYRVRNRLDESMESFQTALRLSPDKIHDHLGLGWTFLARGAPMEALASIELEPDESYRLTGLVMACHALGRDEESDHALEELIGKHADGAAYNIALALAYRAEIDSAFAWLDRAFESRDTLLSAVVNETFFAPLHSDPRWPGFLEKIGRSPGQLDSIRFEVKLPNHSD
jgi:TolB-like protein/Flp pilus assembly protein TadD